MSRRQVLANNRTYEIAMDDPAIRSEQWWAVVAGQVIDEITGEVPRTAIKATVSEDRLAVKVTEDGMVCVVARPWLRFPPLESEVYPVHLRVEAEGCLPLDLAVTIPSNWRRLTADALAGTTQLSLDSADGLTAGQALLIGSGTGHAERREIASVNYATNVVTLAGSVLTNHFRAPAAPLRPSHVVPDGFTTVNHVLQAINPARTHLTLDSTIGLYAGQRLRVGAIGPVAISGVVSMSVVEVTPALPAAPVIGSAVMAEAVVPVQLGQLRLRRKPIVIRGRVLARTGSVLVPVPGATVSVAGIWRTLAEVRNHAPASSVGMVAVKPGLYAGRLATAPVGQYQMNTAAGDDRYLVRAARAGEQMVEVGTGLNITAGTSILGLDPDDGDRREQLLVSTVSPTPPVSARSEIGVNQRLRMAHASGCKVARMSLGAAVGAGKHLVDDAMPGDQTVFLDSAALTGSSGALQVGSGNTAEYQQYHLYTATSDADGYYALPLLHRLARIQVEANALGHPAISVAANNEITFQPDYSRPENWLDVVFQS